MPVHTRSLSLREARAPQGQAEPETPSRTSTSKRQSHATTTLSTGVSATKSENSPSRTKSVSSRNPSSNTAEPDATPSVKPTSARKSQLPHRRTRTQTECAAEPASTRPDKQPRQPEDAQAQDPPVTPRPKSSAGTDGTVQPSQVGPEPTITPAARRQTVDPVKGLQHKTPKSANTRLERSLSLRQPTTPKTGPSPGGHSRHRSQVSSSEAGRALRTPGTHTPGRATSPTKSPAKQNLSPRKATRPGQATTPATASGDGLGAPPSSYITSLQTELLQLQLLYSQALEAKGKWDKINEEHFRQLYESASAKYRDVKSTEKFWQCHLNAGAISQWRADATSNDSSYDFAEQIQILSRVLQDTAVLTLPQGGRYDVVVDTFKQWFEHATQVRQSRATPLSDAEDSDLEFIDPLGADWKDEAKALTAKLELCARELDYLDVRPVRTEDEDYSVSALARTVKGHKTLLASMLEELKLMGKIEADLLKQEEFWMKRAVDDLLHGTGVEAEPKDDALPKSSGPIWQRIDEL